MLKLKRFLMVILSALLVFVFGVACKGGDGATLKEWSAPTYSNVSVGNTVYVQSVVAQDTDGELYTATSRVIGPAGEIAVSNSIFTASVEGMYTIEYTVKFNNMDYTKSSTFQATANSGNPEGNTPGGNTPGGNTPGGNTPGGNTPGGNTPGGNTPEGNTPVTPNAVLGSLQVTAGSENYFAVSGNTVTVSNSCSFSDYKSVGYTLSGWTLANGKNVSIRVTNNTSATLGIKYKVVANGGEQYGYPDLSIAPGATQTYTGPTGTTNLENPSSVTAIELFVETTASSGTFTVEGQVYGGGNTPGGNTPGGNTPVTPNAVLGSLQVTAGAENYFAVSGNTVTVRNSCSFSDYKSVGYTLSGWTLANGKNVSIRVTNNTSATLGIKYKVVANGGEQYGYPDLSIAPGATQTYTGPTGTTNLENPSSVTAIELFVETTASSGTFTVEGQVYGAGGPSGSDMGTTQLSAMELCYDDPSHTDYMSVSGNTITIKQAFSINTYKGVKFTVSNWDAAKAGQVTVSVTNNTTGAVTIKYKANTNTGTGWGYPDLTVAAGANNSYTGSALTNDQSSATSLESIELFIGAEATGSLTITLTLF